MPHHSTLISMDIISSPTSSFLSSFLPAMDLRYLAPRVDFMYATILRTRDYGMFRGNCYENLRRFRRKGITFNSPATRLTRIYNDYFHNDNTGAARWPSFYLTFKSEPLIFTHSTTCSTGQASLYVKIKSQWNHRVIVFIRVYELERSRRFQRTRRISLKSALNREGAVSGPQWWNVNASFNASRRDTMAVVAGRLTALSEDRNVLRR